MEDRYPPGGREGVLSLEGVSALCRPGTEVGRPGRAPRIKGIVLAGTYHSAGSTFERLVSRPLLPVVQTPLICYALRWLHGSGIGSATICANSASRSVRGFLDADNAPPLALDYYEDWTPRGPAGCVRDAGVRSEADTFVITDGTAIPTVDIQALLATHERSRAAVTLVVHQSRAHATGADGLLSPAGIYVLARRVLDFIPKAGFQDIKENVLPRLHLAGERLAVHAVAGPCLRVLSAQSYLAVNEWMVEHAPEWPDLLVGYQNWGEGLAHTMARIDPTATVLGPVVFGPGSSVGRDAVIVGPTTIGPGSTVGEGAVLSRSVVWSRCLIGRHAVIDRCLLADDCVVEPASTLIRSLRTPSRRLASVGRLLGQKILGGEPRPAAAALPVADRVTPG